MPVLAGCIFAPLLAREQEFDKYDISFQVPIGLKLEEKGIYQKEATYYQGAVMSSERNFMLEWFDAPDFSPELAKLQALNGPAFFESTSSSVSVNLAGSPAAKQISGFDVTFAEMNFKFTSDNQAPGIIGVWYCPTSQRAIIFMAVHKRPLKELDRFVSNFSCE